MDSSRAVDYVHLVTSDPITAPGSLLLAVSLRDDLVRCCVEALPRQAFGVIGGPALHLPTTLYPCRTNLRNDPEWRPLFESFGAPHSDPDMGFVIAPQEQLEIQREMSARAESIVGVFHSHRQNPAVPTAVDVALHRHFDVPCYIVSVMRPEQPELRIYRLDGSVYEELGFDLATPER